MVDQESGLLGQQIKVKNFALTVIDSIHSERVGTADGNQQGFIMCFAGN